MFFNSDESKFAANFVTNPGFAIKLPLTSCDGITKFCGGLQYFVAIVIGAFVGDALGGIVAKETTKKKTKKVLRFGVLVTYKNYTNSQRQEHAFHCMHYSAHFHPTSNYYIYMSNKYFFC